MKKFIKATIINLIVALFIVIIILGGIKISLGQKIDEAILLVNQVAIKVDRTFEEKPTTIDTSSKRLQNYPEYGTQYATIEIPKIGIELPVYYGDTL